MVARAPIALLLAGAPLPFAACSRAPDPATARIASERIVFRDATLEFKGGQPDPVVLLFRAQEDRTASTGRILDLQIVEKADATTARFAGSIYRTPPGADLSRGRVGDAFLTFWQPRPAAPASAPSALGPGVSAAGMTLDRLAVEDLEVKVHACASGILAADATGSVRVNGARLPVTVRIESRR